MGIFPNKYINQLIGDNKQPTANTKQSVANTKKEKTDRTTQLKSDEITALRKLSLFKAESEYEKKVAEYQDMLQKYQDCLNSYDMKLQEYNNKDIDNKDIGNNTAMQIIALKSQLDDTGVQIEGVENQNNNITEEIGIVAQEILKIKANLEKEPESNEDINIKLDTIVENQKDIIRRIALLDNHIIDEFKKEIEKFDISSSKQLKNMLTTLKKQNSSNKVVLVISLILNMVIVSGFVVALLNLIGIISF